MFRRVTKYVIKMIVFASCVQKTALTTSPPLTLGFDFCRQILDYTQYYIDLESSVNGDPDDWRIEYNLTHYYGLHEVTARSLHAIAETFQEDDSPKFDR